MSYALQVAKEIDSFNLTTQQEAISYFEAEEWAMAMNEEMGSLQKNQTWELVELPEGKTLVGCNQIFKKKYMLSSNKVIKYKARLVAKDYGQKEEVDCNEIFSLIV